MINFGENTIEQYQEACEALAYSLAQHQYPRQYSYSDEQIASILKCEGLKVSYKKY